MTRPFVMLIFGSMFAASSAAAQQIYNGLWVVNSERLSRNAACRDRDPLPPGRDAQGQQYSVRAARVAGDTSGLRPGYNAGAIPTLARSTTETAI